MACLKSIRLVVKIAMFIVYEIRNGITILMVGERGIRIRANYEEFQTPLLACARFLLVRIRVRID
jgi:hypothetical protein